MHITLTATTSLICLLNYMFACLFVCLMVLSATFNNISAILMEETGVFGENLRPVASHWQTLSHNVVYLALIEIRTHNISGDGYGLHWLMYITMTATAFPIYDLYVAFWLICLCFFPPSQITFYWMLWVVLLYTGISHKVWI